MLRVPTETRPNWPQLVESRGLTFHSVGDVAYWDESAYYLFEATEIDAIEVATSRLDAMCLEAVGRVIAEDRLGEMGVPDPFHDFIRQSWDRDEHTIYGRFDLAFDGLGPPKLLEYNADTPTALLEAAVIQWFWAKDLLATRDEFERDQFDQFNSIHERLIEAWGRVARELGEFIAFAGLAEPAEDLMTASYLRDTAIQAGLKTEFLTMGQLGWDPRRRAFTDLRERAIGLVFKLYPWEWMLNEPFGRFLPEAPTRWLEPPWKMVLSSKAILPILWEMYPESPYLLAADFEPTGDTYVSKPIHSREGSNVTVVIDGQVQHETGGQYGDGPRVFQAFQPLPEFDGQFAVVGSWMVNGHACGIGLREDDGPITRDTSRFVPHLFRKRRDSRPPTFDR